MPTEASYLDKGMSTSILQINNMQLQDRSTANQRILTSFENEEWPLLKNFNNKIDEARGRTQTRNNYGNTN